MWKDIIVSTAVLLTLDYMYIMFTKDSFAHQITLVQRVIPQINIYGAIICYVFLISGLYYFILRKKRPIWEAFLLGLLIYGVYDSTNYATFKKWSPEIAIMDTAWGGVLLAATTYFTYIIKPMLR